MKMWDVFDAHQTHMIADCANSPPTFANCVIEAYTYNIRVTHRVLCKTEKTRYRKYRVLAGILKNSATGK